MPRGDRRQLRRSTRNRSPTLSFTSVSPSGERVSERLTRRQNRANHRLRVSSSPRRNENKRSCFPLSIRRRMRARHRYDESPSGRQANDHQSNSRERRLTHSPIQKSLEHEVWAHNSQGIKIAMELKDQGVISEKELQDIVQGDKRFYTHNPSTLVKMGAEKDNTCPISLQTLQPGPGRTITIIAPTNANVFVRYDTLSLADYLIESGSDIDPIQRRKYTDDELRRIDSTVKLCTKISGLKSRSSVYNAVKDVKEKKEKAFISTALYGLDNLIGELIGEIFDLLENGVRRRLSPFVQVQDSDATMEKNEENSPSVSAPPKTNIAQEAYAHFLMFILPNFSYLFAQMMDSDIEYAQQCLEQYISRLKGPPNRPTEDKYNILPRILDALKMKQLNKKEIQKLKLEKEEQRRKANEQALESVEKRVRAGSADSVMDPPV